MGKYKLFASINNINVYDFSEAVKENLEILSFKNEKEIKILSKIRGHCKIEY